MEPDEIFFSIKQRGLIIESDENDPENLNYENYNIIKESSRMKNLDKEETISAQIIQLYGISNVFGKLFCQLKKFEYYFITCIKFIEFKEYLQSDNLRQQNELQMVSSIKGDQMCQELFYKQNFGFVLFCFSNFFLKLYTVDFENKTKLLQQFKLESSMYTLCKRKIFQISDQKYLVAFIQCQNWGVIAWNNEEIDILLNEQIITTNYSQQITYLENFELCQNMQVMLFTQSSYYLFRMNNKNQFLFFYVDNDYSKINSFLLSQTCIVLYQIQNISSLNKTVIKNNYSKQEFEGTLLNFKLFMDILFFQTNNQLHIIFNQELQQVIKINSSKFYFDDKFKLICQIDLVANEILFYRFSYPRFYIKPTKKFIYLITSQFQAFDYTLTCFEVNYHQKSAKLIQTFGLINNCNKQFFVLFSKKYLNLLNDYRINLQSLDSNLRVIIFDKLPFNHLCRKINYQLHKEQTLLYYQNDNQQSFSLFQTNNYIEMKDCLGEFQYKIQTSQYQVLQYKDSILLWKKDGRILRLIKFEAVQPVNIEYRFKSEIINIFQYQDVIIVFTKNEVQFDFYDLKTSRILTVDQNIKNILYNLYHMYLQQNYQTIQFQAFYYSRQYHSVIQFFQHLIMFTPSQITLVETDFIQMIQIKKKLNNEYYIIGIHLFKNLIFEQIIDDDQLSTANIINLYDYEIVRQLLYQINNDFLAIATRNSSKNFILLFCILNKQPLKQIKTIQIGRLQFFFQENYLLYYDQEDQIQRFNMRDFDIQLEIVYPEQNPLITFKKIYFQLIPIDTNFDTMNLGIEILNYNKCFELLKKQNNVIQKNQFENNFKININDYIFGPIDHIQIINNGNFQIEGPLILSEQNSSNILQGAKMKNIYLGSVFKNFLNLTLFQYKNNSIALFQNTSSYLIEKQEYLQNIILINEEQLLFIFFNHNTNKIRGVIYLIDQVALQLKSQPIFEIQKQITPNTFFQSFKTGNLILFKEKFQLEIYSITRSAIYYIQNNLQIIEILKIKGDNDLYISLSLQKEQNLQFKILSLNQGQFQVEGIAILLQETIDAAVNKQFQIKIQPYINYEFKLQFLECRIDDEKLQITILQISSKFSIISLIEILKKNLQLDYKPLRILRNFEIESQMEQLYFSDHCLILKSSSFIYFYDLKGSDNFDYIGKHTFLVENIYHQINTTHFIFLENSIGKIFIGEIGYKIKTNDSNQNNITFTLLVENAVSQIELKIFIQVIDDKSLNQIAFWVLFSFLLVLLLLVIYFFIRRRLLNNKNKINQKIRISQNKSEL